MTRFHVVVVGLFLVILLADPALAEDSTHSVHHKPLFELSLEELSEIPVVTASKHSQSQQRASSSVTVITKRDIKRWSIRTIYDLLKRVPGFFPSSQATWPLVGSRGIVSDGTDHILLMIDGHRQNSIIGQGYQQQDMLPLLDKAERVEIIRGPGSVLWGSSAVLASINIITATKSTGEEKNSITPTFESGNKLFSANATRYFETPSGVEGMISATYFEATGYNRDGKTEGDAFSNAEAAGLKGNVEFPWGVLGNWPKLERQFDGYELYGRIKVSDSDELIGRILESSYNYPWDSLAGVESDLRTRKAYLEYRNSSTWSDTLSSEVAVYADILLQNRFPRRLFEAATSADDSRSQDQTNEETAFGVESTATKKLLERNTLKLGIQYVRTKIGANRDSRFNPGLNRPTAVAPDGVQLPYVGVESGFDNNVAAFFEDSHDISDNDTVFAGLRYDYNDFREKSGKFLPRAGIIHAFDENWVAKYVFNTGYLRPNAVYAKSTGVIVDDTRGPSQGLLVVDKSERILSHDLEFSWTDERAAFSATLFYMQVSDFISFDAFNNPQGYKNLGDIDSKGIEIAGKYPMTEMLDIYANYAFANAEGSKSQHQGALYSESGRVLNYPRHTWNAGLDYLYSDTVSLNLNLRGWNDMDVVLPITETATYGEFGNLSGEHYLDIAINFSRIASGPFDLGFFCSNIFDNQDAIGMITNDGFWYPRGRSIGASLKVRW